MKKLRNLVCLAIVSASLLFPGTALASDGTVPLLDDQVVVGGTYTLDAGEVLDGSLIVIGGVVSLEPDSTVDGDVLVFGGNVTVEGRVSENLVAVGGVVVLSGTAEIYGDLIAPATVVRRDDGAQVYGQIIADTEGLDVEIPEIPEIPEVPGVSEPDYLETYVDSVSTVLRPVTDFVWSLIRSFALAAVALLVLLFIPRHTEKVSDVVQQHPVSAGGLGILTVVLSVPVMIITTITIILIPATILISIALVLGLFFGIVAVGSEIGRRMSEGFGANWKRPLQTAVGTFSIAFLISIFNLAHWDWLASLLWIVLGGIGLGAVMMTRFGTREYQAGGGETTAPPATETAALDEVDVLAQEVEEIASEEPPKAEEDDVEENPTEDA